MAADLPVDHVKLAASLQAQIPACVAEASATYAVPDLLLYAILAQEGGSIGKGVRNSNGTLDLGPAQINSVHLPELANYGISMSHLAWYPCVNIKTSAWILRKNYITHKGNWFEAIRSYNIGTSRKSANRVRIGHNYATAVVKKWWGFYHKRVAALKLGASPADS